MKQSLSIVIPARNEAENLPSVLRDINVVREVLKRGCEVIVVDDGSTDATATVASKHGAKVIANTSRVHGKGAALQLGFAAATGDYIVMMDADCSHRPEDIPLILRELDNGAGLVIGSRSLGGSDEYTFVRTAGNIMITGLFNLLFGTHLTDAINGFKAFRRALVAGRPYSSRGFEIEIELVASALRDKMRIAEVPSHERARYSGEMKSRTFIDGSRFFFAVLRQGIKYRAGL